MMNHATFENLWLNDGKHMQLWLKKAGGFNPWHSTPVDSAQLMDCPFFYHREFFSYLRARIVTEYFFHESTLLYFFNTLILRVRNAQTDRLELPGDQP